jgi:Tat protein secretion system quality control protein TatD with DNase activity
MDKNLSKDEHYRSVLTPIGKEGMDETVLKKLIDGLISPLPLLSFLFELESNLGSREGAMLGEVGIDKAFRLPNPPEFTHIHKNSSITTTLVHQLRVLEAQIEVAIRLRRNISFHSVRSPHDTLDFLNRLKRTDSGFQEINICLHSFSGSPETVNQIQKGAKRHSPPLLSNPSDGGI